MFFYFTTDFDFTSCGLIGIRSGGAIVFSFYNVSCMNEKKNLYIVYTRARWEKKVVASLTKKKIENYCPLNKIVSQVTDGTTWFYEPLFASFVFVHVTNAEHTAIKQLPGVLNIVYWLGEPAIIKEEEINIIRYFL